MSDDRHRRSSPVLKLLALFVLAGPALSGCATGNLHAMGRRSEHAASIDAVYKARSEPRYLVEYTNTVSFATWGSGSREEKRYQVMTPGSPLAKPLETMPEGFTDAVAVPIRRVREASQVRGPGPGENHRAYVVYKNDVVLLVRTAGGSGITRMELPCASLDYREGWAYPIEALAAPATLVIDAVTLPVQIGVMGSAFHR
jgi:uncharacterized protein YceK